VLIDFSDLSLDYKDQVLKYLNLSEKGDMKEAMANLYSLLRDSENTEGAEFVIISSLDGFDDMCGDCD